MRGKTLGVAIAAVVLATAVGGFAQAAEAKGDWVAVRNTRVSAVDVAKAAEFYKTAFRMQEILRYERPNFLEVILNFGGTVEEAKAAKTTRIALITRAAGAQPEGVSNIVLNVGDMDAVMKRVAAGGGTVDRAPTKSATSGNLIAMIRDPAGNRIELIMQP